MTIEEDFETVRAGIQDDWHMDSTGWEVAESALDRIEHLVTMHMPALENERDALKLVLSDVVMLLQGLVVTANQRIAQLPEEK